MVTATATPKPSFSVSDHPSLSSKPLKLLSTFTFRLSQNSHETTTHLLPSSIRCHHSLISNVLLSSSSSTLPIAPSMETFTSRFMPNELRKGCDVLIEALEREGVTCVFAYPGGASLEIYQALTRSNIIRNVLPRHEQGGIFAAEGYARATGFPSVCIASSGPGATNLISGLANALLDSCPLVAITGQVSRKMIGTNAFQEIPIIGVTCLITKHNYIVLDVEDIPRIVREAFFFAKSGRPGPVLIDVPKDIQQQLVVPDWDQPMRLPGCLSRLSKPPNDMDLEQIVSLITESKKPVPLLFFQVSLSFTFD